MGKLSWGGVLSVGLFVTACTRPNPDYVGPTDAMENDGHVADGISAPDADLRTWSQPERIFATTSYTEERPVESPDGKELFYFGPELGGGLLLDIFVYTRHATTDPWVQTVTPVVQVNGAGADANPAISADGLDLFFSRAGDIYVAHRTSTTAAWTTPQPVGSSGSRPRISKDGLTLYFYDSSLTCPSGLCMRKRTRAAIGGLWSSATVEMFPDGGGGYQELDISGDGLQILLSAPVSPTTAPVATARRSSLTSTWSAVTPISELNLFTGIRYAGWSWDGQQIYFAVTQDSSNKDIYSSRLQ